MKTSDTDVHPFADADEIRATVAAVTERRELGKVTFTVQADSTGNLTSRVHTGALVQAGDADESRAGKFTVSTDEPVALLGTDTAISPAEYLLTGLAGCYTVTLASLAASRGIELNRIQMNLGFDIDLSGFLGIDDQVRKGAQGISVDIDIDSPHASRAELEELVRDLEQTSPIRDTLAHPVPVTTTLK